MKKRPELLLWRAKYWKFGLRRPWHWCFLGLWFVFMASMAAWHLLGPALREGRIVLRGTVIHHMQTPEWYWAWVAVYLLFITASLACSIWAFRGVVLSRRCLLCDKA